MFAEALRQELGVWKTERREVARMKEAREQRPGDK